MSDETPAQVTLDDLDPVTYLAATDRMSDITVMCRRCFGVVPEEYDAGHERWHAAIESAGAVVSGRTGEFQPLRDQLIEQLRNTAFAPDAQHTIDLLMPLVEAWGEKYLSRATVAEALLARVRSEPPFGLRQALLDALQVEDTGQDIVALVRELRAEYGKLEQKLEQPCGSCHPCVNWSDETWRRADRKPPHVHEWDEAQEELRALRAHVCSSTGTVDTESTAPHEWTSQHMANVLTQQGAALERLRDVVHEAGCPVDTNVIDWIEQQLTELDEHRKHDCQWTTDDVNARMNEQRAAFVGLLQLAGRGRAAYAENLGEGFGGYETLMTQANNFHAAARLIADPTRICLQIPASMLPEAGKLSDDESVAAPPMTDSLAAKIIQAIHDPGKFVDRAREWDDTWDRWEYESVAAWGARAVIEVLNSVDADVDVPERPASTDEPVEDGPCPSLYLHEGQLLCCTTAVSPANEHGHAHYLEPADGRLNCVQWIDSQAVPVPWPLDQEPPAGINTLRDTGESGLAMQYLVRLNTGWVWAIDKEGNLKGTAGGWEIASTAQGELHVVRP